MIVFCFPDFYKYYMRDFVDFFAHGIRKCIPSVRQIPKDQSIEDERVICEKYIGKKFLGKYLVKKKIGQGGFGKVFQAENSNGKLFSIKLQPAKNNKEWAQSTVYESLVSEKHKKYFPTVFEMGKNQEYNFLVMELLYKNVAQHFKEANKEFKIETIQRIGLSILLSLKYLHEKGFIHGDIKPHNMMTKENGNTIRLIDFGLAQKYRNERGKHRKFREGRKQTGSLKYISIGNQKGWQQSRRDDIQSLGYVLLYLLKGKLPWQGIQSKKKQKNNLILKRKQEFPLTQVCKNAPQIEYFITYARKLRFEETPNYQYLSNLLKSMCKEQNLQNSIFKQEI